MASTAEPPSTPLPPNNNKYNHLNGVGDDVDDDDDASDLYRDPTLAEVIDYLKDDRQPQVQANAAAYLQHLMYKNEDMKNECRLETSFKDACRKIASYSEEHFN